MVSGVMLVELVVLASWSLYYGLCWKNDDILCHLMDPQKPSKELNTLSLPTWWKRTLHVHLIVEHRPETDALKHWSVPLQEWMEASKFQDWPYYGVLEMHMQVVPSQKWPRSKTNPDDNSDMMTAKQVQNVWDHIQTPNDDTTRDSESLRWILYIPSSTLATSADDIESKADTVSSEATWSSWTLDSDHLLTLLMDSEQESQSKWSGLSSVVGLWLEKSAVSLSLDGTDDKDRLRQLQLTWHKSVIEDLEEWKSFLTADEYKSILITLGEYSSDEFAGRLQSIKQAQQILQDAVSRHHKTLLDPEFPLEHYAAIFFPLLFPLALPFLASFIKEMKRFKSKRKKPAEDKSGESPTLEENETKS